MTARAQTDSECRCPSKNFSSDHPHSDMMQGELERSKRPCPRRGQGRIDRVCQASPKLVGTWRLSRCLSVLAMIAAISWLAPSQPPPQRAKSSSQYSRSRRTVKSDRAASDCRNSARRIFPEIVFGKSENSSRRIRLNGETRVFTKSNIDFAVAALAEAFDASAMKAFGTDRRMESGLGTTAASATLGCSISTLSNSKGLIR